jgi:hypothetical protein
MKVVELELVGDLVKAVVGFARLFRPTYAGANVGHPSLSWSPPWSLGFALFLGPRLVTDCPYCAVERLLVWRGGIPHLAKNERDVAHPSVVAGRGLPLGLG